MLRFVLLLITSCAAALAPPTVLLVSGSDSGGGAGLQAEIKTCEALGVFSTNAVTAITAQNTVGVHGVYGLPPARRGADGRRLRRLRGGRREDGPARFRGRRRGGARRIPRADVGVVVDRRVRGVRRRLRRRRDDRSDQGRAAAARDRDHAERRRARRCWAAAVEGPLGGPRGRSRRGSSSTGRAPSWQGAGEDEAPSMAWIAAGSGHDYRLCAPSRTAPSRPSRVPPGVRLDLRGSGTSPQPRRRHAEHARHGLHLQRGRRGAPRGRRAAGGDRRGVYFDARCARPRL